jgi:hypothetical protein
MPKKKKNKKQEKKQETCLHVYEDISEPPHHEGEEVNPSSPPVLVSLFL